MKTAYEILFVHSDSSFLFGTSPILRSALASVKLDL